MHSCILLYSVNMPVGISIEIILLAFLLTQRIISFKWSSKGLFKPEPIIESIIICFLSSINFFIELKFKVFVLSFSLFLFIKKSSLDFFLIKYSKHKDEYPSSLPSVACDYGYKAFDHTDTDFDEHPTYECIEINEVGTNLGLTDDSHINDVQIGFDFQYFGET